MAEGPINELTGEIVDCAVQVHKELGPGLLERIYEDALVYEFREKGISFERQKTIKIPYKEGVLDSEFRLDLLVNDQVVVELKNCEKILPIHEAQLLTYLKITNKKVGLLLNFNASLMKNGIKRMVL